VLLAASVSSRAADQKAADGGLLVTIEKEAKERVEEGPVVTYRFEMAGSMNYQRVIVPDEKSKTFVVSLLKSLNLLGASEAITVSTLKDYLDGMRGENKTGRAAEMAADLKDHAAIVLSYAPAAKAP
jgi:hypothetical protein